MKELLTFIDYVHSFYGKDGVYDFGATKEDITLATAVYLRNLGKQDFAADSIDREHVREVLLNEFSYNWNWGS